MTAYLPPRLAAQIRERISLLREAWQLDSTVGQSPPRLHDYPVVRQRPHSPRPPAIPRQVSHARHESRRSS